MCRLHVQHMKIIKSQLPRRESERRCVLFAVHFVAFHILIAFLCCIISRNHRLARHADVLQCIETRISMLMMTYNKYIEANMCCFIPGRVIDEVLRLLRLVGNTSEQFRAREILQELRDITSMAIEHFDEKIAPDLKKQYQDNAKLQLKGTPIALIINAIRGGSSMSLSDTSMLDASTSSVTGAVTEEDRNCPSPVTPQRGTPLRAIAGGSSSGGGNSSAGELSPDTHGFLVAKMNARIKREINTVQLRHMKLFRAQNAQISELRAQLAELKRRVEETDAKNREIHLNVNQIAQQPTTNVTAEPFIRKPNIKPRTATIILKRRLDQFDKEKAERKALAAAGLTEISDGGGGGGSALLEADQEGEGEEGGEAVVSKRTRRNIN